MSDPSDLLDLARASAVLPEMLPEDALASLQAEQRRGEHRCDQCRGIFEPRAGSGGSPQRFCSTACRSAFHSEASVSQRSPACSASSPLTAVTQPPEGGNASWIEPGD